MRRRQGWCSGDGSGACAPADEDGGSGPGGELQQRPELRTARRSSQVSGAHDRLEALAAAVAVAVALAADGHVEEVKRLAGRSPGDDQALGLGPGLGLGLRKGSGSGLGLEGARLVTEEEEEAEEVAEVEVTVLVVVVLAWRR